MARKTRLRLGMWCTVRTSEREQETEERAIGSLVCVHVCARICCGIANRLVCIPRICCSSVQARPWSSRATPAPSQLPVAPLSASDTALASGTGSTWTQQHTKSLAHSYSLEYIAVTFQQMHLQSNHQTHNHSCRCICVPVWYTMANHVLHVNAYMQVQFCFHSMSQQCYESSST